MIRYSVNGVLFLNLGDFEYKYSYGLYSYSGVGEYPNARRVPCDFMLTIECSRNRDVGTGGTRGAMVPHFLAN